MSRITPGCLRSEGFQFFQVLDPLRPERIKVDIADQLRQIRIQLTKDGFITVLEQVSASAMLPVFMGVGQPEMAMAIKRVDTDITTELSEQRPRF